jgi:hypothetical protein
LVSNLELLISAFLRLVAEGSLTTKSSFVMIFDDYGCE